MDLIRYNPAEEPLLAYDDSSNKMVLGNLVSQYGEVQKFVDIDTIRVSELQSTEIEEEMKNLVELKYGLDQIGRFSRIVQREGLAVLKTAELCCTSCSSA